MTRLDQALVDHAICDSREKAKRAIMAGQVANLSKADMQDLAAYYSSQAAGLRAVR